MAPHFNPHFSPHPLHTESDAVAAFHEQWEEVPDAGSPEPWRELEPWLKEVPDAGSMESSRKELRGKRVGNEWVLHRGGHDALGIHLDAATGRVKEAIVTTIRHPEFIPAKLRQYPNIIPLKSHGPDSGPGATASG